MNFNFRGDADDVNIEVEYKEYVEIKLRDDKGVIVSHIILTKSELNKICKQIGGEK